MNNEEIEAIKKEMVKNLKEGIEENMLENFVENYEDWQAKLKSVNAVISHVDPSISLYEYNEFCKKIIEITKDSLENIVDYDKLFLTSSEYFKIMQENGHDEKKMEEAMLEELNKKFMDNLMLVLNKDHLKGTVKYKLQDQFVYVEKELDKSLEIANEIIKKHNRENL
jgi:anaerobic ribonucleoside-triphosphate reductase